MLLRSISAPTQLKNNVSSTTMCHGPRATTAEHVNACRLCHVSAYKAAVYAAGACSEVSPSGAPGSAGDEAAAASELGGLGAAAGGDRWEKESRKLCAAACALDAATMAACAAASAKLPRGSALPGTCASESEAGAAAGAVFPPAPSSGAKKNLK